MDTNAETFKDSALLSFSVSNYRSFKDQVSISLLATKLADDEVVRQMEWREEGKPIAVLPGAGIFGGNASGKTNVLLALSAMQKHVVQSFRAGRPDGGVPRHPFMLDPDARTSPTEMEIDFILGGVRHTYGFTYDDEAFLEEWAYRHPRGRAALLFHRRGMEVVSGSVERSRNRGVAELLRPNALFLSTAASANHPVLKHLYRWFSANLWLAGAASRDSRQLVTIAMLEEERYKEPILGLLRAADLGLIGAEALELDPEMRERIERVIKAIQDSGGEITDSSIDLANARIVRLLHRGTSGEVEFAESDESMGTLVWLGLVGPVVDALEDGTVFLVDELDASLHPALVEQLVRLFQNPSTNPRNAQLIFNSHDVSLLGDSMGRVLGRDQIWFTEKYANGSSGLFPLSDLAPRKKEAIAGRYLLGRYGGTPIVTSADFDAVLGEDSPRVGL